MLWKKELNLGMERGNHGGFSQPRGRRQSGSDSQGKSLRKILYQAYHMLKKVKSAQKSACPNLSVCRVFPPTKKHDRSADRQMTDLIFRDTLLKPRTCDRLGTNSGKKSDTHSFGPIYLFIAFSDRSHCPAPPGKLFF